jgi:prophage regulatory protein
MDSTQPQSPSSDQLLRIHDVVALTTLSKSCINLWVAQERFPKPIALSSTVKVWRATDISVWIEMQFDSMGGDQSTPALVKQRVAKKKTLMPVRSRPYERSTGPVGYQSNRNVGAGPTSLDASSTRVTKPPPIGPPPIP